MAPATCRLRKECPECAIAAGACSLVSFAECLQCDSMGMGQDKQRHIVCASNKLEAAEKKSKEHLDTLKEQKKELLLQRKRLEDEEKEKEMHIGQLNITLASAKKMMEKAQSMLGTAEWHLHEVREQLKKVKKKEKCEKVQRNFILVVLLAYTVIVSIEYLRDALKLSRDNQVAILLSVLAASFQASLYATQKAVQELKVSIRQLEDKVSEFKQEVDAFEKQKEEIRNDHRDQQRISEEMDREREKFSEVNEKEEVVKEYHSLLSLLVQMVNSIQNDSNHDDIWDTLNEISQSMMQLGKEGAMYFGCSAGEEKTKQVRRLKGIVDKFL
ncbi:tubulin glycylase 3C [Alligator mississippiensis]|uniref:tubulin glycylase 3C n=1 Tax=Alligator mississippiensis TaxID=8496 RepID=UPI0007112A29|nr:tubulin glycylase 3C [Alligator mississippiensis]